MKLDRKADQVDEVARDSDEATERALTILFKENERLKRLVAQLSETVIRNVIEKKYGRLVGGPGLRLPHCVCLVG